MIYFKTRGKHYIDFASSNMRYGTIKATIKKVH